MEDILVEKRKVEKENTELSFAADGRGMTEKEMKVKEDNAKAK